MATVDTKQSKTITAHPVCVCDGAWTNVLHEFNNVLRVQFMFIFHVLAVARTFLHWWHMRKDTHIGHFIQKKKRGRLLPCVPSNNKNAFEEVKSDKSSRKVIENNSKIIMGIEDT